MLVNVNVRDFTGDRCGRVTLSSDITIGQARPQIVESLRLSEEEFDGEPITWVLYNESAKDMPVLSDTQSVEDALKENQVVRVVPNVVAGGTSHV